MSRLVGAFLAVLMAAACTTSDTTGPGGLTPPTNLTYQLIPSGDPNNPQGIELRWSLVDHPLVNNYVVYSRSSTNGTWHRRGEVTSAAFEDLGTPDVQYYVTSQAADGSESDGSNIVTVDANNQLPAPSPLVSVSLDEAVQLSWSNSVRRANPNLFSYYRVYSASYDLDNNLCGTDWVVEGTTVSEDFVASGLPNGVPRCFAVSVVSVDGHESEWTAPRPDTPRYDAHHVLLYTTQGQLGSSGFRFYLPSTQELGAIVSGNRTDIDFRLERHSDASLWMVPVRNGTLVTLTNVEPIDDLTSIDVAPFGFSTNAVQAIPGYGYVFQTSLSDGLHFGGLRVTYTAANYMIFDWSYQSDPGNPELRRVGGH